VNKIFSKAYNLAKFRQFFIDMKRLIPVTKATHLPNFKFLCQNIAVLALLNKHFTRI